MHPSRCNRIELVGFNLSQKACRAGDLEQRFAWLRLSRRVSESEHQIITAYAVHATRPADMTL
jgi:hypothetical protein